MTDKLYRYAERKKAASASAEIVRRGNTFLSRGDGRLYCIIGLLFTATVFMGGYYLCFTCLFFFCPILTQTGPAIITYADFIGFAAGNVCALCPLLGLRYAVCEGEKNGRIDLRNMFTVYSFGSYSGRFALPFLLSFFRTAGVWAILAGWIFHGHYIPVGPFLRTVGCVFMNLLWLFATRIPALYSWLRIYGADGPGRHVLRSYSLRTTGRTVRKVFNRLALKWLLCVPTVFIHTVICSIPAGLASKAVLCRFLTDTRECDNNYPERKTQ